MKLHFSIALIFISFLSNSQNKVVIEDPEIVFEFIIPKGWKTQNEPYYFHIYNPKWNYTALTMTYFESSASHSLDEILKTRKTSVYPEIKGYNFLESGDATIDEQPAKWVKYKSISNYIRIISIEYFFMIMGKYSFS